jgi:hypothetical protein
MLVAYATNEHVSGMAKAHDGCLQGILCAVPLAQWASSRPWWAPLEGGLVLPVDLEPRCKDRTACGVTAHLVTECGDANECKQPYEQPLWTIYSLHRHDGRRLLVV